MRDDFHSLPPDLPVPQDDGACDHLPGTQLPSLLLRSTSNRLLNLAELTRERTVLFFYPRTGRPDEPAPENWDEIPGARGCTPQSCSFRDRIAAFHALGTQVFGVSTQSTEFQRELVERVHLPYEVLSDAGFELTDALRLPTFEFGGTRLLKRMAWVCEGGKIIKAFYPVFPPDQNADTVLTWLRTRNRSGTGSAEPRPMDLQISEDICVTDIRPGDKAAYLEHLKEKQIYDQTLAIPFPYTASDADWWINHVAETTRQQGRSVNWAIRRADGSLIGGIGFHDFQLGKSHKAELGYWLAKPYWGRGIMTEAVRKVTEFGFQELGLARITANVFFFNAGSARVLEKAGYALEGHLRRHYKKDGKIFDGKLYAKVLEGDSL